MSSTAIGLGVLAERNLMATTSGESVLSVALLQDIAAIPILAMLPLPGHRRGPRGGRRLAGRRQGGRARSPRSSSAAGSCCRPTLRWIAKSDTPEIFTAASLLLVVATAALMNAVGLSMALGAFLAGVLLAESEYRRELETDIEPFKGLLLGLFFIAVGMNIDFQVVLDRPLLIAAVVVAFLAIKAAVLWAMGRAMPIPKIERPVFIILLAQGGEFGFVVFQTASQAGVISAPASSFLIAAVTISMAADAAAAGGRRSLVDPDPGRPGAPRRRRGAERAAERPGDHRRLRPLRPDRRPDAVRQRRRADRARSRRRGDRGAAQVRLARATTATRPGST